MGEVIQFISKAERDRLRLIREARANYDSVFPPVGFRQGAARQRTNSSFRQRNLDLPGRRTVVVINGVALFDGLYAFRS